MSFFWRTNNIVRLYTGPRLHFRIIGRRTWDLILTVQISAVEPKIDPTFCQIIPTRYHAERLRSAEMHRGLAQWPTSFESTLKVTLTLRSHLIKSTDTSQDRTCDYQSLGKLPKAESTSEPISRDFLEAKSKVFLWKKNMYWSHWFSILKKKIYRIFLHIENL